MKHLRHPSRKVVNIEVQTSDGSWRVIHTGTPNNSKMIHNEFNMPLAVHHVQREK